MNLVESEYVELKKSSGEIKEGIISIAAILNKHGNGELYFGVKNDGAIIGQTVSEKTLRTVSQAINNHIEPKIFPEITAERFNDLDYIKIRFRGTDKPYYAYGRVYLRVADEDRQLSPTEIEKLILAKNIYMSNWDSEISSVESDAILDETLSNFIKKSKLAGRIPFGDLKKGEILKKLGLLKNNKLTEAARFLFTNEHDIEFQTAVFATSERLTFLDINKFNLPLIDLLEAAELYIRQKMNWRVEFIDFKRVEIPEIPMKAIREALVNSLIHRDFNNPKGNEIAVFRDRIEIYNPGAFPPGLTPDDYIYKSERSWLRNPKIAEIFYFSKDVEKWGSGIKRVYNECKENGIKVSFDFLKTGIVTTFWRRVSYNLEEGARSFYKVSESGNTKEMEGDFGTISERFRNDFGTMEHIILKEIEKNPRITAAKLADNINKSSRTIENYLAKLKKKKILKRIGPKLGGFWQINKNYYY